MWAITDIMPQSLEEAIKLATLSTKEFGRTKVLDLFLLANVDVLDQFKQAFGYIGWTDFWNIEEEGCEILTQEFLMTLQTQTYAKGTKIYFRLFNKEYSIPVREFAGLLGFSSRCSLAPKPEGFNAREFWADICGEATSGKYSITKIHNPTLRFLARCVSLAVFPRASARCAVAEDLKCLYAMCKKKHYAPILDMVRHWISSINTSTPITCTSFVTRIARKLGVLNKLQLEYIPGTSHIYGLNHFVQGHFLRTDAAHNIYMTYLGTNFEL